MVFKDIKKHFLLGLFKKLYIADRLEKYESFRKTESDKDDNDPSNLERKMFSKNFNLKVPQGCQIHFVYRSQRN